MRRIALVLGAQHGLYGSFDVALPNETVVVPVLVGKAQYRWAPRQRSLEQSRAYGSNAFGVAFC
jgi:hypothetical protein